MTKLILENSQKRDTTIHADEQVIILSEKALAAENQNIKLTKELSEERVKRHLLEKNVESKDAEIQ